jgi:hypothetical protein
MKKSTLIFAVVWIILPIYAQEFMDNSDCIMFEFNSSLNPRLENGIVITGIAAIDSLNIVNHANTFKYYDFSWTSRLKYILIVYFDPAHNNNVEDKLQEYQLAAAGLSKSVEYIPEPSVEMIPGEFLYSDSIYHDVDTAWMMYDDNDEKRNWSVYRRFQYPGSVYNNPWQEDIVITPLWEDYWGDFNRIPVMEFNRPFPYYWALHGHSSLWHHLENYNNTYRFSIIDFGLQSCNAVLKQQSPRIPRNIDAGIGD